MSAKKLGRFAGLVFVLAVVFGGVTVGASTADETTSAVQTQNSPTLDWV
ncbi:hypothetical protein KZ829_02945 [Actinoplanes hulinensis]|uniref:Uncharacterized protein n=1 Tax=Actinoplanes hulinensis TaxID=1144547 RepID=A0ABS7AWY7_9ACTN|nr:hypothetical protein [Actinoplanes hulinensis]MBW6432699.1 hypothetical protein [Actinoplanes hulinensis]